MIVRAHGTFEAPEATREQLNQQAFDQWRTDQHKQAKIEIFVSFPTPTGLLQKY